MKNKKKLIFVIVLFIFFLTGCSKDKSIINNNSDSMNYNETIASAKELDLLFKNSNAGLENINNYLLNNSDILFSKEFIKLFNHINYDNMSEFEKHLIEAYSYFCVMSGYSGRSESEIYGYLEDNSFVGEVYINGYNVPKSYTVDDIKPSNNERIITIVASSRDYSKKVYMYYEVKAIKDDNTGNINYKYYDLSWDLDGPDNSLHYSNYNRIFVDDYITKFNYKNNNKNFSKLLYYYGFNVLASGKDGVQGYKTGVQNAIDSMK